jgi:predicted dehydrogenase
MAKPVKWGILGAAEFARKFMAPAIHAARGAELYALATSTPAKAEAFRDFAPGLKVHASYEALLADPEVEAVYIPLPNTLHIEWSKKAVAAGKHVLTEKPIAMKAGEIDELIALRDASGLMVTEAYMIVHHPQWQRARALLAEGAIGRLIHVEGVFTYHLTDLANIRNRPETGGGGIPDIGVYTYGSTRWATGQEPLRIDRAAIRWENGVDTIADVSASFPGFTAHFINATRMAPLQDMTFHGDEGVMRLTAPFNAAVFSQAELELRKGMTVTTERWPGVNHYVLQVENFCRSLREGAAYPWSLEDARGTQAMIDMVFAAGNKA